LFFGSFLRTAHLRHTLCLTTSQQDVKRTRKYFRNIPKPHTFPGDAFRSLFFSGAICFLCITLVCRSCRSGSWEPFGECRAGCREHQTTFKLGQLSAKRQPARRVTSFGWFHSANFLYGSQPEHRRSMQVSTDLPCGLRAVREHIVRSDAKRLAYQKNLMQQRRDSALANK